MNIESTKSDVVKTSQKTNQTSNAKQNDSEIKFSDELKVLKTLPEESEKNSDEMIESKPNPQDKNISERKKISDKASNIKQERLTPLNVNIANSEDIELKSETSDKKENRFEDIKETTFKLDEKILDNKFSEKNYSNVLNGLNDVVKEINEKSLSQNETILDQMEYKSENSVKLPFNDDDNTEKGSDLINNDFNINENKDILPQMNAGMNFAGNGQPFSSFMNNDETKKTDKKELSSTAAELAEEAAILSTMAENMAIANKNNIIVQKDDVVKKPTQILNPVEEPLVVEPKEKTVQREDGIKKIDVQSGITIETVIKYDSVIMNEADVEVFATLVEKGEVNLDNLAPKAAEKSVQVSKTLADMLAKSKENNQPLRIDFDNNISVIIRISRDGKITADFLPSSQVAEAYLKENLPILRQRFDDNNIKYDELNQRERRDNSKDNNRKKGRNDE